MCAWAHIKDITFFPNDGVRCPQGETLILSNGKDMEEIVNTGSFGVAYKVGGTAYGAQSTAQAFKNNTWSHECYHGTAVHSSLFECRFIGDIKQFRFDWSVEHYRRSRCLWRWKLGRETNDFHVYNRALSASEVLQLYDMGSAGHSTPREAPPGIVSTSCSSGLTCGLVGYWTFDGKDINGTAATTTDRSGNGNTGTLVNMSATTSPVVGKIGQALRFNGTSQYVNGGTGASLNLTGNQSYSVWIKPTASLGINQ